MKWFFLYFLSLIVFPPLVFAVLIVHVCMVGEKKRSEKRIRETEEGVRRATQSLQYYKKP